MDPLKDTQHWGFEMEGGLSWCIKIEKRKRKSLERGMSGRHSCHMKKKIKMEDLERLLEDIHSCHIYIVAIWREGCA